MKYADFNLILLRGVSGAGKSTVAELFTDAVIISTDDYFLVNGIYSFDAKSLIENHVKCQNAVEDVMKATHDFIFESLTPGPLKNTIVVHNTFTKEWEMEAYFVLADKYKYTVHTVVVENRHGSESIHNVPQDRVEAQRERFEVTL